VHEVRVKSLENVETMDGEVRILANSGDLVLVFPASLWEGAISAASSSSEPTQSELEELTLLRRRLKEHAAENSFATILEDVPYGGVGSDQQLDLVLRPAGMFAVTTGYVFLPVVSPEHMALFGVQLDEDDFVEQAYLVGAVIEDRALVAGDERLKVLSIRSRRCSSSRFELAPELWQVLSEGLGWRDVEPAAPAMGAEDAGER
jgi:hypothetical protein